jgi:predicted RNase H-like HicB family nuclease
MFAKSEKSSKAIDRPFDPKILRKARQLAKDYQIILQYADGEYYGRALEMPYVMADGPTPDACVAATRSAIATAVARAIETGETYPTPARENRRTEQLNIRITPEEKIMLEEAARSKGYRGISDFVRSTSLANIR